VRSGALLTAIALLAAAATAVLAARGAPVPYVIATIALMSIVGSLAVLRRLAVRVGRGELVVLIGGRHRGKDRVWRGWRIVHGGQTLRLPAEEVVRVPVPTDRRDEISAAIDGALFREGTRGDNAALIRAILNSYR
jgi:hypothetical protein